MRRVLASVLAIGVALLVLPGVSAGAADDCAAGAMPYLGIPGAELTPEIHVSKDASPVRYVLWRGFVPSFDGLPLSVDVTVPCEGNGPRPTVVMPHGFTDDKTVWEETGKSDSVRSTGRPGSNSDWNNIWFASRGYAVLTYTARGWHDSCGPDTPGRSATGPAPQCAPFQYWIHLDDKRWEVRDLQWLTGGLVQSRVADPKRLAVTGGSYGGAPTAMAALLAGKSMCGAVAEPAALGADPCRGKANGDLVPWTTPDGKTALSWAAALPLYTYSDLLGVLAPNGRATDGWSLAPRSGNPTDPFGVPIASTVSGLILAAKVYGALAPPGTDPTSDIVTSTDRLLAGNPFPQDDPQVQQGIREYRTFKSAITIEPQGRVPMFWVQGLTDALFPGLQGIEMLAHVRAADPAYPFKLFLGDIGHDYAAERQDEWDAVKRSMNAFIDHYLRPDRTPSAPRFDVTATVTRCLDHDAPMRAVTAATWDDLHPDHQTFTSATVGHTSTATQGPAGVATDPISTATLGSPPTSYKGCRIMRPSTTDPTVATYAFPLDHDLVLMGGPVIDVAFAATGGGVPLSVRLWDVAADGSVQGLVTRGTYRAGDAAGSRLRARFQLAVQGYRFPAGHRLKVEVTANDSPYFQASSIPAEVTIQRIGVTLPLLGDGPSRATTVPPTTAPAPGSSDGSGHGLPIRAVLAALVAVVFVAARMVSFRARRLRPPKP